MKTQDQLAADDALIRQRILSNAHEVKFSKQEQSAIMTDFASAKEATHAFPAAPEILGAALPQEAPGKVWPKGYIPYVKARVGVLFDTSISLKSRLRSLPLFGYAIGWMNALLRLPLTRHRHIVAIDILRQQNSLLHAQIQSLNQRISAIAPHINSEIDIVMQRIERLEAIRAPLRLKQLENVDSGARLMQLEQLEIARKLKQLTRAVGTESQTQMYTQVQVPAQSVNAHAAAPIDSSSATQNGPDLARFYLEFEALFRGSREDIKQRQKVYLPHLYDIQRLPKEQRKLFVDVGCGRGEWLELLSECEIPAIGIDSNTSMVDACLQRGHRATVADGIEFLRQQEKSSLSGVSGFHIIEHLPFEKLIALFDAAYAALGEGGILIFETPNPENLIVGACNFHYDPTHLKPIVPDVAQFIARQRGFREVEIKRLHPFPEQVQSANDPQVAQTLNRFLFSAQDYAVIARK